jgi:hypothetical protein
VGRSEYEKVQIKAKETRNRREAKGAEDSAATDRRGTTRASREGVNMDKELTYKDRSGILIKEFTAFNEDYCSILLAGEQYPEFVLRADVEFKEMTCG